MKVLVAHNRYRSDVPSGENVVVDAEVDALREAGVEVVTLFVDSDDVSLRSPAGLVEAALGPVYAPRGVARLRRLLRSEQPDVVHLHNVYPLLSPWVVRTSHAAGVPVVQTVHNFRHDCVSGTYFRDGRVCTECAGRAVATPALQHGCYRDSRAQSVPMVLGRTLHRDTWREVDRLLALTPFHAEFLQRLGVPPERVAVRPTSAPDPGPAAPPTSTDLLFVGRLEEQKGVRVLLDAWNRRSSTTVSRLHVVGDGPLAGLVDRAAQSDQSIVVHGLASPAEVGARIEQCGAVVLPSTWFEGLPRVLVETFARGRAAMVSDHGGLAGAVTDDLGWRVRPEPVALAAAIDEIDPAAMRAKGAAARETYLSTYSPSVTTQQLIDVYTDHAGSRR